MLRLKLLAYILVAAFLHSPAASAGDADDIAAEVKSFCLKTPTGKSYPSFEDCMEYQGEGALTAQRAIHAGYPEIAMACLNGAKYEQYVDFAVAGLCVIAQKPGLAK